MSQSVNLQFVIQHAKNQEMQFVMWNVRSQNAKLSAQIEHVSTLIAQNALQFASLLIAWLIANLQSHNVKQSVKNQNAIGSVTSHNAQNQNANLFAKTQIAVHKSNAVNVEEEQWV